MSQAVTTGDSFPSRCQRARRPLREQRLAPGIAAPIFVADLGQRRADQSAVGKERRSGKRRRCRADISRAQAAGAGLDSAGPGEKFRDACRWDTGER